jgi:hypothetical protein
MPRGRISASASAQTKSLRDEVREALLTVLRDSEAPAAARASAGRTLIEHFDDQPPAAGGSIDDMSESELDRLIGSHKSGPSSQ